MQPALISFGEDLMVDDIRMMGTRWRSKDHTTRQEPVGESGSVILSKVILVGPTFKSSSLCPQGH